MDKNMINETVANMVSTSNALDKFCNDPKNYNSEGSLLLEQFSWELQRKANELIEFQNLYGF